MSQYTEAMHRERLNTWLTGNEKVNPSGIGYGLVAVSGANSFTQSAMKPKSVSGCHRRDLRNVHACAFVNIMFYTHLYICTQTHLYMLIHTCIASHMLLFKLVDMLVAVTPTMPIQSEAQNTKIAVIVV